MGSRSPDFAAIAPPRYNDKIMPQDHYVAQTYLRAFADPETPGRIHAYRKSDAGYFSPSSTAVCKSLNWDLNSKYLSPQDALGRWLKIFEPHWAGAVTRLLETHNLSAILAPKKSTLEQSWHQKNRL
jgi:hypothetical protein